MVVTRSYQGMMVITMPLIQSRFLQVLGWKTSKIPPPCAVSQNQDEAWRCSSRGSSTIIGPKPCRLAAGGKCLDLIGTWMRRKHIEIRKDVFFFFFFGMCVYNLQQEVSICSKQWEMKEALVGIPLQKKPM